MSEHDATIHVGSVIAERYWLEELLGEGAHGRVFRARDLRLDREVAVKVLKDRLASEKLLERFEREAELAVRIRHPHVVQVLDRGVTEEETHFLVQSLVEGESLRQKLDRREVPDEETAAAWTEQLLDALAAVHEAGVLHRDVKTQNVMIRRDGSLVLADFGLGRAVGDRTRLTSSGVALGTPSTLAPELLEGRDPDELSDQYSAACVVYELRYGERWRRGRSVMEMLSLASEPVSPLEREARFGRFPGVDPVLHRALQTDPARRYPSVRAMIEDLRGEARGLRGERRERGRRGGDPDISRLPTRKVSGRRWRLPPLVIALAVGLMGFLAGRYLPAWMQAGAPREEAPAPPTPEGPSPQQVRAAARAELIQAAAQFSSVYRREDGRLEEPSTGDEELLARLDLVLDARRPLLLRRLLEAAAPVGVQPGEPWEGWEEEVLEPVAWFIKELGRVRVVLEDSVFQQFMAGREGDLEVRLEDLNRQVEEVRLEVERSVDALAPESLELGASPWLAGVTFLVGSVRSPRVTGLLPLLEERFLVEERPRWRVWLARAHAAMLGVSDVGVLPVERRVASLQRLQDYLPAVEELQGDRFEAWGWELRAAAQVLRQPGAEEHTRALQIFDRLHGRLRSARDQEPTAWTRLRERVRQMLEVLRGFREPTPALRERARRLKEDAPPVGEE